LFFAALALSLAAELGAQERGSPDYSTLMQKERAERVRSFNEASPEDKSTLVRTHIRRFRSAHRERLSAEQLASLDAHLELMSPEFFAVPERPELMRRARRLAEEAARLFSPDDLRNAFSLHGPEQPPDSDDAGR
jgi:hypothetical protein